MKKIYFLSAALFAAILSLGLTSCSVDDDEEIVLDNTIQTTIADEVLTKAADVTLQTVEQTPAVVELAADAPVSKIVIGTDGKAILYMNQQAPRAIVDGANVYTAEYEVTNEGIKIVCSELGVNILVPADLVGEITFDNNSYAIIGALQVPATASPAEHNICRTWSHPVYTAGVFFDKLPVYGASAADKAGVNSIRELASKVLDRIVAQDSDLHDEGFKLLSSDIESLTFTNEKVYLRFTNGNVEESTWTWTNQSKGQLKTVIDGKDVALEARFEGGTPNKAYFVIDANCEGVGGLGVHTLTGRLVCTMNDATK